MFRNTYALLNSESISHFQNEDNLFMSWVMIFSKGVVRIVDQIIENGKNENLFQMQRGDLKDVPEIVIQSPAEAGRRISHK